jgi:hypothetical protein
MSVAMMIAAAGFSACVMMLLAIPIVGILTHHRRKLEEIRLRHKTDISGETKAAIEALRKEMAGLRDTTTEYDVSFDTALHRIESRVGTLEQRMQQVERGQQSARLEVIEHPNAAQVAR